jgi:cell division protease FtsH
MAQVIDEEVRTVIDKNYQRAEDILKDNMQVLHNMAQALMDWETIDKHQINILLSGKEIGPPEEIEPEVITKPEEVIEEPQKPNDQGGLLI